MSIIMGKWATPDLSDLESYLLKISLKIPLLTVDQDHAQEAEYKN